MCEASGLHDAHAVEIFYTNASLCCWICFLILLGIAFSANRNSYVFWRFIQNSADVLKNVAKRTAVSPVIPRPSLIIAVIRFVGTPAARLFSILRRSF